MLDIVEDKVEDLQQRKVVFFEENIVVGCVAIEDP